MTSEMAAGLCKPSPVQADIAQDVAVPATSSGGWATVRVPPAGTVPVMSDDASCAEGPWEPSPVSGDLDGPLGDLPFTVWGQYEPGVLDLRVFDQGVWWVDARRQPHRLDGMSTDYLGNVVDFLEEGARPFTSQLCAAWSSNLHWRWHWGQCRPKCWRWRWAHRRCRALRRASGWKALLSCVPCARRWQVVPRGQPVRVKVRSLARGLIRAAMRVVGRQ